MVVLPKTPLRRARLSEHEQDAESLFSFNPQPAAQADRRPADLFKRHGWHGFGVFDKAVQSLTRPWLHQTIETKLAKLAKFLIS